MGWQWKLIGEIVQAAASVLMVARNRQYICRGKWPARNLLMANVSAAWNVYRPNNLSQKLS